MPAGFSLPQHAVGLVAARYGKENLVEGLETHALNAELNASISTVQLSHGRHKPWQVTPGPVRRHPPLSLGAGSALKP